MAFMGSKTRRWRTVPEITISIVVFCAFGASSSSCVRGQTLRQIAKSDLPGPEGKRFDYLVVDDEDHFLLSAHLGPGILYVIDLRSNEVVKAVPGLPGITGLEYVPGTHKVYTSDWGEEKIGIVDLQSMTVIKRLPTAAKPNGSIYAAPFHKVYVTDTLGKGVAVVDVTKDEIVKTIEFASETGMPQYDSTSRKVYVNLRSTNEVAEIDPATDKLLGKYPVDGCQFNHGMAIDSEHQRAFLLCTGNRTFTVFALNTHKSIAHLGQAAPLKLEQTIEPPDVEGRIDHMSIDVAGQRLFVSALGNGTAEVIDLKAGKRTNTISGLKEPQGALYLPDKNQLFVASGKDGTVKIFDGTSLQLLKTIEYGEDADNLRYDSARQRVYVGFGGGALGEMDTEGQKTAETKLDAHPESFQLERNSSRIYVNLPGSRKISVVDREAHSLVTSWGMGLTLGNYAMALDEADHRVFVISRVPARLVVIDTATGKVVEKLPAVGDCDDIFWDATRKRIYATGGEGSISVFEQQDADHYREIGRVRTVKGARTSFFSPDLGRLYVAARRQGSTPAQIQVFSAGK